VRPGAAGRARAGHAVDSGAPPPRAGRPPRAPVPAAPYGPLSAPPFPQLGRVRDGRDFSLSPGLHAFEHGANIQVQLEVSSK